ncbi:MAG TPA: alpha/beta fold hydrolase [Gaiellaceae bacterium]|nr:alpha/beta fold hydrolase [Gaiellaceae bacterium]
MTRSFAHALEHRRHILPLAVPAVREVTVAVAALVVVAVHVADDSFLQPQPGTSATDHLASGLAPIAVLLVAAGVYARLRDGLRAIVAMSLGLFGIIVGAGEAGYYTLQGGPSGDDYTGLLAIPAGALLVGIGAVTLWRSRTRDDRLWRRYLRRAAFAVAGVAVVIEVFGGLTLGYVSTHVMRAEVPAANLGTGYQNVSFRTSDGLRLQGWYVPSRNGAAVIAFPGRRGPQAHARMLARNGYGVLLFDRRGEGASEGDPNLFGWGGEKDIDAAVAFLRSRAGVDPARIGGIGLSVGGELMLQAAAQSDGLAAVVSDGAGARALSEDLQDIPSPTKWIGLPFLVTKSAAVGLFSNTVPPPKLTDLVTRITVPLFLIWAPNSGGENLNPRYYAGARGPKAIWAIPEAEHIQGIAARPEEYERRVIRFFDRALGVAP